jgi:hypothetical protein
MVSLPFQDDVVDMIGMPYTWTLNGMNGIADGLLENRENAWKEEIRVLELTEEDGGLADAQYQESIEWAEKELEKLVEPIRKESEDTVAYAARLNAYNTRKKELTDMVGERDQDLLDRQGDLKNGDKWVYWIKDVVPEWETDFSDTWLMQALLPEFSIMDGCANNWDIVFGDRAWNEWSILGHQWFL